MARESIFILVKAFRASNFALVVGRVQKIAISTRRAGLVAGASGTILGALEAFLKIFIESSWAHRKAAKVEMSFIRSTRSASKFTSIVARETVRVTRKASSIEFIGVGA